jgi:ribosomal protein S20
MKTLLTLTGSLLITLSIFGSIAAQADSNSDLNACIKKTYNAALQAPSSTKASDLLKFVSKDIKACKDQVKSLVKAERAAKKRSKLESQLKKLQAKLGSM